MNIIFMDNIFFSSRRRHTRWNCDWSSDVCSSDLCEHAHLPLQSGSTRVLKAMRRTYSRERYLRLVDELRAAIPDLALTTDIIVGFPGETESEFVETLEVVEGVGFDAAFTFVYSPRAGTEAAAMAEQVPGETKRD